VHEAQVAALLRHERDRRRHAAADRVAGDRDPVRVEPVRGAFADDPAGRRVALLDRDGVPGLGRAVVLHERECGAGPTGQLAHEPVVRAGVPEHPAAAVHVQDHRQRARGAGRAHDAHLDVTDVGRHRDPALLDRQLADRRRLHVVEHLARLGRRHLVQERRVGGRLDERLRGGLEHDRGVGGRCGHGEVLSVVVGGLRSCGQPGGLEDQLGDRAGLRDGDRVRRALDRDRPLRAGAVGHVALELGGDDAVLLADQEP
jgi:hypothetical protein